MNRDEQRHERNDTADQADCIADTHSITPFFCSDKSGVNRASPLDYAGIIAQMKSVDKNRCAPWGDLIRLACGDPPSPEGKASFVFGGLTGGSAATIMGTDVRVVRTKTGTKGEGKWRFPVCYG